MRKGKVLRLKNCSEIIEFIIKNRVLLILSIFFIIGFFVSVFLSDKYQALKSLNSALLNDFIEDRTDKAFLPIATKSFFNSMLFVLLGFVCGSSVIGSVFIPFIVAFKSFLLGGIAVTLYSVYSLKGIAFYTVLILPSAIIFVFGFLYAMCEAFDFSLMLTRLTFPQTMPSNISFQFKAFSLKYLIVTFIVLISALIDALLCGNFLTVFNLN